MSGAPKTFAATAGGGRALERLILALACFLVLVPGCGGGGDGDLGNLPKPLFGPSFEVADTAGLAVPGATVYLVPVTEVDQTLFDGLAVRSGAAENRDEPLEDPVRTNGALYPQAVTDAQGMATIAAVPAGRYFYFVAPAPLDAEHLPGGSGCRTPYDAVTLAQQTTKIVLSSSPAPGTGYTGTSQCLTCHPAYSSIKTHAHRLGFAVPGQLTALQDDARYPDYRANWNMFLPAISYTGGTQVWFYDYDPARGFDKFKTSLTDPTIMDPGAVLYVKAWLWRSLIDDKFRITLENIHAGAGVPGPMDPPNLWHLQVDLTYGGAVYKQRNLVKITGTTPPRKGRYPLLQFQSDGNEGRFDRTRKVFRDYHLDWYWNNGSKIFSYPAPSRAFEGNCTACHSTGFERYFEATTGEWLSRGVADPAGTIDIDGDGDLDEINLGCEVCHGPGQQHAAWALAGGAGGQEARYIVSPEHLSPSREMLICGRCHDRPQGNGIFQNDEPLDVSNEMAPVGISRADYLASYVIRKGPASSDYWGDETHSKSHHQQYSDLLKSSKHHNNRLLVTCSNCHDGHGYGAFRHHLTHDPDDNVQGLCFQCHGQKIVPHMFAKTGVTHAGTSTGCARCHMPKTAKSGSGTYAFLLGVPTGAPSDALIVYHKNDITSHLFTPFPYKTLPQVAGQLPFDAMPIPYTESCGMGCHQVHLLYPKFLPSSLLELAPQDPGAWDEDGYGSTAERER